MVGREVCRMHGGKTPRGLASPHTKHAKYSKDLPTRMIANYERAMSDPELLGLRDEIALIDSRLHDLLERVDTGESGQNWDKLTDHYYRTMEAYKMVGMYEGNERTRQFEKFLGLLEDMEAHIGRGKGDYANWREIGSLIQQRRSLVESERKRMVEMHQVVRSDQFVLALKMIQDSLQLHVKDRKILAKIGTDISSALMIAAGE